MLLIPALAGCASLDSMYPDDRVSKDIRKVESSKHFVLSKPLAFQARNRHGTIILKMGRYSEVMTSSIGSYYLGGYRSIEIKPVFGGSTFITGGVYVPHNNKKLCLVFWVQSASPEFAYKGWLSRAIIESLAGSDDIKFFTWIEKHITAIPLCNTQ